MNDPSRFKVILDPDMAVERSVEGSEEPWIQDLHGFILLFR
jgi:hypothetical protein